MYTKAHLKNTSIKSRYEENWMQQNTSIHSYKDLNNKYLIWRVGSWTPSKRSSCSFPNWFITMPSKKILRTNHTSITLKASRINEIITYQEKNNRISRYHKAKPAHKHQILDKAISQLPRQWNLWSPFKQCSTKVFVQVIGHHIFLEYFNNAHFFPSIHLLLTPIINHQPNHSIPLE